MIAIFRSIATYTPRQHPYAFRGWLAKIARHTAINYLNRKLRPAERNGTNRTDMHGLSDGPFVSMSDGSKSDKGS